MSKKINGEEKASGDEISIQARVQMEEEMKVPRIISCKVRKTKQSCVYN
jgi:hypothetical protein